MASLALVSKYGIPPLDWQNAWARFEKIWRVSSRLVNGRSAYHSLSLFHIDLVPDDDLSRSAAASTLRGTHEWEVLRVHGARLYQKLVPPAVQRLEAL